MVLWDFDKGEFTTAKPLWIKKTKAARRYNFEACCKKKNS